MAVLFSSWLVSLANLIGLRHGVLERRRYIVFALVLYLYGLFKSFEGSYMYMYPPPFVLYHLPRQCVFILEDSINYCR
jgi:hypothetical protein